MPVPTLPVLLECLSEVPDPRVERTRLHALLTILVIALCAVLCGAEGWDDIASFGRSKQEWLQEKLGIPLPHGIPSADTFRRVFARLDPVALQRVFRRWTKTLHQQTGGEVIALDGKTLRHSFDTACGQNAIHMVSAWASSARLILGQVKVEEKSNEITAVPALLSLLDISGAIVTTDAMSCQKAIAAQILGQGADYILAVKDNQPTLAQDIQNYFTHAQEQRWENVEHRHCTKISQGHGRLETRRCDVLLLQDADPLWGDVQQQWRGLRSLLRIQSTQASAKGTSEEVRYFISSLAGDASASLKAVRQHWGIENRLHYVLDVSFDEDACRIRKEHAPENLAVLRHIALNLLRQEKSCPRGIKARRKQAGWDNDYLALLLVSDCGDEQN